jgi:inosine-uridine nucleoside N-ribohydrolase
MIYSICAIKGVFMLKNPVKIILDTDMGNDCDDAGALGLLNALADNKEAKLLCVSSCTSIKSAPGTIDAINRYYGRYNIPVGAYKGEPFFDNFDVNNYTSYICNNYDNSYKKKDDAKDAVALLRKTLSEDQYGDIKIVSIGPLRVMSMLLDSMPDENSTLCGKQLIEKKVSQLVAMGGYFSKLEPEFNIASDILSSQNIMNNWPVPIVLCPYEIGSEILTGSPMLEKIPKSPVSVSYKIYCKGDRESWDPITVLYAVRGNKDFFEISKPGKIKIDDKGISTWNEDKNGKHFYLSKNLKPLQLKDDINNLLLKIPTNKNNIF